ncbi:hypothetical protein acsn021_17670 [Anaerocolumna cellulosilytica]|uniref:Uncharacterized protein n=1 Tax=Anaerocolumna cellulosilytica TaxID=433286 RepID=A0A6S6R568_9FIRM|nr:alpha/beta hydrolase-fold protein [Anaerocolumna cellulosilytica]MBB5194838.1 enterochelin esterase-like enzyme [Anaerocolumna cellulosilytica]BCJ94198.1 hypothetical protein acsn021_17670 [Anaerocolumna cellulosilytica]
MKKVENQAVSCHQLFFDPLNQKVAFKNGGRDLKSMHYIPTRQGARVYDNNEVEFCYYAPGAKKVSIAGISGSMSCEPIELVSEENGYFSRRVQGIEPGFHYHNWFVDDVQVRNPFGAFCYGCFEPINFFEVPEEEDDFYFLKDVSHGEVRMEVYQSSVNGHLKSCYVYTPPEYHQQWEKTYPVLYIQHGVGESESGWLWNGKLNFIMDNLLAEGKCKEMLVVMCSGYSFQEGEDPVFYPGDFDKELMEDVIPFIQSRYRTKTGRDNKAIAGLSLGSAQASLTVVKHPGVFSALGVFSGVAISELDNLTIGMDKRPDYVLLAAGEGEERIISQQKEYQDKLRNAGIACDMASFKGFHEWHVWRKSLARFVQNIFNKESTDLLTEDTRARTNHIDTVCQRIENTEIFARQTYEMQPLFFDTVYKGVIFAVDEKGRPAGRYKDIQPGVVIKEQGVAEFYFIAPKAKSVEVQILGMERIALHKAAGSLGEEGYWQGIVREITPGFHYHEYFVNGISVINPWAPLGYGCFKPINYLEMPEPDFDIYLLRSVPHGSIHMNYYKSSQTGRTKVCYVYTPPGYEENREKRYPVLYLQHGGGETEIGWIWQGKICNIMDNLLALQKAVEMIIVMNTGYSFRPDGTSHPLLGSVDEEIVKDCIPFIDSHYRTYTQKEKRAMAGLSMGGMQTQKTVFHNTELFAWAGIFSGGLVIQNEEEDYTPLLKDLSAFQQAFKLLYIACGEQDGFYEETFETVQDLKACNIPLVTFFQKGYHDWTFWRHCVTDFLQRLFY